ncbi:hypothetical protein LTR64_001983 [Lithohypha guttulata]|uniref:uncharacterized protein n=1 Tax=Lithohypha guttulata TaxID=1690604 RepID=UPI002DDDED56|nr:hypothetical protein LTR51_007842 [Lithohypha guttulata]
MIVISVLYWTLSPPKQVVLLLFIAASFAPAAIWAGAITPLITSIETQKHIAVPQYTNPTYGIVSPSGLANESLVKITTQGTFTYRPELTLQGIILDNMRQASSANEQPIIQSKMDNVNYRYRGRSYGVGSSVGLKTSFGSPALQTYQYVEPGLLATSNCIYNESSACFFEDLTPEGFTLQVYNAVFQQPNANESYYIASAGQRDYQVLTVSAASGKGIISDDWTYYTTMISPAGRKGHQYGMLHKVQCEIKYAPTNFDVFVNATNGTIVVTPTGPADQALFPNYTDLTRAVTHRIYNIGQLFSSTQWGSPMGDALLNNAHNVALAHNESTLRNETVLEAVSASMDSMLDSMLGALSGAQLMVLNASSNEDVKVTSQAVMVGENIWIYITSVINALLTIVFLIEVFRTRTWEYRPDFDYMNVQDLVIATSAGGTAVAASVNKLSSLGSPSSVRIRLVEDKTGRDMLVLAEDMADAEHSNIGGQPRRGQTFQLTTTRSGGYEQL